MKAADEDAVSGPVTCAWNMSFPAHSEFPSSNTSSLTLVHHSNDTRGEGYLILHWKPICDDGWSLEAAHVACRQLGFTRALQATRGLQASTDAFSLDQVNCRGNETDLEQCSLGMKENCVSGEAAGVVCDLQKEDEIDAIVGRLTEECFAKRVIYGPELTPKVWVLPTVLDCQQLCGATQDCNTFSYDTQSWECRLHSVREVEGEAHIESEAAKKSKVDGE